MSVHVYFSLIPEALIVSMLPPEQFGPYYATGLHHKSKGQALFFDVDPAFRHDFFDMDEAIRRCVPHEDGRPKNSVYAAVYRVAEHLPVHVLRKLYLCTAYGQTLALQPETPPEQVPAGRHLYQDLAPVNSMVVSTLPPIEHYRSLSSHPTKLVTFPALCFVELSIGALATDPEYGDASDLPYSFINHLRETLLMLEPKTKENKMVQRVHYLDFPYRMVKDGFYFGNGTDVAFFRMPSHDELRQDHLAWWRQANA